MNTNVKTQIAQALEESRKATGFKSDSKYARSIGLTPSDYSNIVRGKWVENPQLVSQAKWIGLARAINFSLRPSDAWVTGRTQVYEYITQQLENLRQMGMPGLLVDEAGIGKTHTCREYARQNAGQVFYINCSECGSKSRLVAAIARAMGIAPDGSTEDTLASVIHYINNFLEQPQIIFDEAGDLEQPGIVTIKRLYNATEFHLSIYMVGADGLKRKLNQGIRLGKNGFAELFSRMGSKYSRVTPNINGTLDTRRYATFMRTEAEAVCQANGITDEETTNRIVNQLIDQINARFNGTDQRDRQAWADLRVCVREIKKQKRRGHA